MRCMGCLQCIVEQFTAEPFTRTYIMPPFIHKSVCNVEMVTLLQRLQKFKLILKCLSNVILPPDLYIRRVGSQLHAGQYNQQVACTSPILTSRIRAHYSLGVMAFSQQLY